MPNSIFGVKKEKLLDFLKCAVLTSEAKINIIIYLSTKSFLKLLYLTILISIQIRRSHRGYNKKISKTDELLRNNSAKINFIISLKNKKI